MRRKEYAAAFKKHCRRFSKIDGAFGARFQAIPLANSRNLFPAPVGATELSRWWSEAQPPGQVMKDISRPGRDARLALIIVSALVQRPSRARLVDDRFPVASPPANLRRASGAEEFASKIPCNRAPKALAIHRKTYF